MFHPVSWFQGGFTGMISVSNPVDSLCQGERKDDFFIPLLSRYL